MARMSATDRREALARAALTVVARDGIQAATTRAIVAEAGMPLASFHYAVPSREDLLRDVVELVVAGEGAATFGSLAIEADDIRGAIRSVLGSYLDLVRADPGREQAMFELTQHALRSPGLADLPAAQYAAYRELATTLLQVGADRYRVRWDVPLGDLAVLATALSDGATLGWLATRNDDAAERLLDLAADTLASHATPLKEPS
ncbi:MAG: TetR family transcriptional regulator C-terminal domain-containing protein [Pseudolysinimonas sp.]|uniref:TetR/AcrR family transcriptional regulator n=1 Tax=Pseudolysinimonas sp. TaxID=2680009 RepID=UPI003263243D